MRIKLVRISHAINSVCLCGLVVWAVVVLNSQLAHAAGGEEDLQGKAENECEDAVQNVMGACSSAGSPMGGLNPQQAQQMGQMQNQSNQAGENTQSGGGGASQQCKNAKDLSGLMGAMSALKGGACMYAVSSCREACGEQTHEESQEQAVETDLAMKSRSGGKPLAPNDPPKRMTSNDVKQTSKMRKLAKFCDAHSSSAGAAFAQAAASLAGMLMAGKCQEQMSNQPQQQGSPPPQQKDCNDPEFAKTNITCICQRDPKGSMCQKASGMPNGIMSSNFPQGPSAPSAGGDGLPSDGSPLLGLESGAKSASGSATMDGGGGGGLGGSRGGGAQASGSGDGAGDGRSGVPTNIIQGQSNSSGQGGGAGGGGGGRGAGGGGGGRGRGLFGKSFNLNDFLPKSMKRGLAGMSISSKDGITGPMGPSIFEKVTKQYQNQKRMMIQDR